MGWRKTDYASERVLHPPCAGKFSPPVGKGKGLCSSSQSIHPCSAPPVPKHLSDTGKKENHSYSNWQCCWLCTQTRSICLLVILPLHVDCSPALPIILPLSCFPPLPWQVSSPFVNRPIPIPLRFSWKVKYCSFLLRENEHLSFPF